MRYCMFPSTRIGRLVLTFLLAAAFGWGCAANSLPVDTPVAGTDATGSTKKISSVELTETDGRYEVVVTGGPELLCSHFKKIDPLSISFYFPQTAMEQIKPTVAEDHPFVGGVEASQLSATGQTAKILISLKQDVDYEVSSDDGELRIRLSSAAKVSDAPLQETLAPAGDSVVESAEVESASTAPPVIVAGTSSEAATLLESVDTRILDEGTDISILADGTIRDFTAFTISEPPRIVFDLHHLSSTYSGLQNVEVDSLHVETIRHFAYPEKIRLVVDTKSEYLNAYTSMPVENGLRISIGAKTPLETTPEVRQIADQTPSATEEPSSEGKANQAAWLNKIEFSSEDEGVSSVLIGTTAQVRYEMETVGDRELQLKLYETRVPQYRKRPLITTRFNSAVDRVTPVQTDRMGNLAIVNFELREKVPFEVTQEANFIHVRFAASSIPPKPLEQTQLPTWQKVLEGKAELAADVSPKVVQVDDSQGPAAAGSPQIGRVDPRTGEIYVEEQDTLITDAYDLERQRRVDAETGTARPLDVYQTQRLKKYTGEKIALNFYETDIKNVFRILGEISQQNFAIDKDVSGRVTLNFEKPVPWDQVLDLVLKMNKLGQTREGDIIRIATLQTLATEEAEQRRKLAEKQAREDQEDLVTLFLRMSYIDAFETARDHLVDNPDEPPGKWKSKFNPDRGKVSVDPKQNMIVVTDIPRAVKRTKEIVTKLDKVTPQVLIEARIVETTTEFSREMGFDWGNVSIGSFGLGDWGQITGINLLSSNPSVSEPTGSISFGFSKLGGTSFDIVDATLEVFERKGQTKTISSPKILTLDGKVATISQGFEIPYEERDSAGGSSIAFKEALLQLTVTPQVTPDDRIALNLDLTRDDVLDITLDNPPLTTNVVRTELLVEDGETIVIGGIITASLDESEDGIPGLMDIPALGYLFKNKAKRDSQTELLIFLTPKVIKLAQKEVTG